jgi:decaprenylphospho-beta-D-erythro-pentofuranosid-2-ulose 2-reductase
MSCLLVIGGNSEIGFHTAKIFASQGFDIHLVSKNLDQLIKNKKIIDDAYKVDCRISQIDLYNLDSITKFVEQDKIVSKIILIAAGYLESPEKSIDRIIKINYLNLVEIIEKLICKNNDENKILSTIIGISSIAGERGKKNNNIYSSSKAGFTVYLDGLRQRLYQSNINVITIKPGYVKTKMIKGLNLPKYLISTPEKVASNIYNSFKKNKTIVYAPYYWRVLMFIYKKIPEKIFKFLIKNY